MRLIEYIEIENFKRFGERQRIELDHPTVLIGPNNCGKTTAIQALALWSQAVKTWFDAKADSKAKDRINTGLNRLNIVSVPVQRTKYFWNNTAVRAGNEDIHFVISVGVVVEGETVPVTMRFRHQGDELAYCGPDESTHARMDAIKFAASISVELLYPMSGLETEEPILQPGRIDVLLGQGQTAQVLRNLCLMVAKVSPDDWSRIVEYMKRLFSVDLGTPVETTRGAIELHYVQPGVKEALDVSMAGRGFQQMLLIFAYLYSHRHSVLLVDEPDAHLEILRQKQVYVLLRDIASENDSQVVMATHSEQILYEAVDTNLTLLIGGRVLEIARKDSIRNALKHYGTEHYLKALQRGYVLYTEGETDVRILRALAERMQHPAAAVWDQRVNSFYVQDNYPDQTMESELERVEGGFGITPRDHFFALRGLVSGLRGVAILDNDGANRQGVSEGGLTISYWNRYEIENYFVSPWLLERYAESEYEDLSLFDSFKHEIAAAMDDVMLSHIFSGDHAALDEWREQKPNLARVFWERITERMKLSDFAEEFFRNLAKRTGQPMLLRKGELHSLVRLVDPSLVVPEVSEKLSLLNEVFEIARKLDEANGA